MRRTELLQEVRKMRFEEACGGWQERRLTQEAAARLLGVCERTACPRESGGSGATWTATRRRGWTGWWTSAWGRCLRGARRSMRWCAPRRCTASATRAGTSSTSTASTDVCMGARSYTWVQADPSACGAGGEGAGTGQAPSASRAGAACRNDAAPEPAPAKAGERLPKELAARGIDTMQDANRYLAEHYQAAFNEEFAVPATEPGTAFVPFIGPGLADVLCEHHERTVNRVNSKADASGKTEYREMRARSGYAPITACPRTPRLNRRRRPGS